MWCGDVALVYRALQDILSGFEYFFASIFTAECVVRVVARQFVIGPQAYLRNNWCVGGYLLLVLPDPLSLYILSMS